VFVLLVLVKALKKKTNTASIHRFSFTSFVERYIYHYLVCLTDAGLLDRIPTSVQDRVRISRHALSVPENRKLHQKKKTTRHIYLQSHFLRIIHFTSIFHFRT